MKNLVLDLDGTLLNSFGKISTYTQTVLKDFCERGTLIILATGRHFFAVESILQIIPSKNLYIICCDGVYVYDATGKKLWENGFLGKQDVVILSEHLQMREYTVVTEKEDIIISQSMMRRLKNCFREKKKTVLSSAREMREPIAIEKVMAANVKADLIDDKLKRQYTIHFTKSGSCEILAKDTNKYSALRHLSEDGLINLEEIIYFGDDDNDRECFENIKRTVAVDNATDAIKELSWRRTFSSDDNGVARFLEQMGC